MDANVARMKQLADKGYPCSQILIMMGLEAKGDQDPDLVRAMSGLAGGCATGNCTCGSLTGGCCLLALFAGKGSDQEEWNDYFPQMMKELVGWFWQRYGYRYGGIDCNSIRGTEELEYKSACRHCGQIVVEVYNKALEILKSNGYNINSQGPFIEYYAQ